MQHYIRRAIAPTTRGTYDSVERSYRDFAASVSAGLRDAPIRAQSTRDRLDCSALFLLFFSAYFSPS